MTELVSVVVMSPPSPRIPAHGSARAHRFRWCLPGLGDDVCHARLRHRLDVRAEGTELAHEVLVAAVDDVDTADPRGALRGQGREEVGEAPAQAGDDDVGGA